MGKGTIDKKSSGETKGRQGSSSRNYDVLGREIFTPDEVRKLDNKKCIIFIRGFDPILDNKYIPFAHPMFNQTADGKGEPYVHQIDADSHLIGPPFEILSQKAVEHYMKLQKKGENIYIDTLTYDEFMLLGDLELSRRFSELEEESEKAKLNRMQDNELEYVQEQTEEAKESKTDKKKKDDWEDNIMNRMMHWSYTEEQKAVARNAMEARIPKNVILSFFYPETSSDEMEKICRQYLEEH